MRASVPHQVQNHTLSQPHFQFSWGCSVEALWHVAQAWRLGIWQSVCRVGVPLGPEGGSDQASPVSGGSEGQPGCSLDGGSLAFTFLGYSPHDAQISPFLLGHWSHWIRAHPIPEDLFLTNDVCYALISKEDHILSY